MKKENRKRGIIYFDSIDLEILELLDTPNKVNSIGWGVLEIVDRLNISHISLKPHIDKLLRLKLICTVDLSRYDIKSKKVIEKKKVGLATVKARNEYWYNNYVDFEDEKYIKEE